MSEGLERKLLLDEETGQLLYYRNGAYYNAETLQRLNRTPSPRPARVVLDLEEDVTAPEEFTSSPVFVRTEDGFTILVTEGESNVDLNYVQSFNEDGEELTEDPFLSDSPILAIVPFQIPDYGSLPEARVQLSPARLPARSPPTPFNTTWLARLEAVQDLGRGLDRLDPSPVNSTRGWTPIETVQAYVPSASEAEIIESLNRAEPDVGDAIVELMHRHRIPWSSRPQVTPGSISVRQRLRQEFPIATNEQIEAAIREGHGTYIGGRDYLTQNPQVRRELQPRPRFVIRSVQMRAPDEPPSLRISPSVRIPVPDLTEEELDELYLAYTEGGNIDFIPRLSRGMSRDRFAQTVRGIVEVSTVMPTSPYSELRRRFPGATDFQIARVVQSSGGDLEEASRLLERMLVRLPEGVVGTPVPSVEQQLRQEFPLLSDTRISEAMRIGRGTYEGARNYLIGLRTTRGVLPPLNFPVAELPPGELLREQVPWADTAQILDALRASGGNLSEAAAYLRLTTRPPEGPIAGPRSVFQSSPRRESPPSEIEQSVQTLFRQLYGLPVELPTSLLVDRLEAPFVSFDQVSSLPIERFTINPLLQPWAGPPGTPNRIITLILRDGRVMIVKARFDPKTNQIFPPA